MSSIMVPSTSGRVLAQPRPIVHINAFCTRQAPANSLFCSIQSRSKARVQHRLVKQEARRQGLTIRAAAAAEGQGFASDEGDKAQAEGWLARQSKSINELLHPFSDKAINAKLLSLCLAQALCSVATLIHDTYLPIYLQDVLGLSNSKIGNLQALAQFLSNASKSLSGTLADILSPSRMIIFGTLLTTLNKPMFAASGFMYATFGTVVTLYWVTAGKVFDRMSKGVREAPGKALIGELAAASGDRPEGAFGLRQAMATAGALVGASIAGLAYKLSGQNYTVTFALATVPATLALLLTISAFSDTAKSQAAAKKIAKEAKAAAADADEIQLTFMQKAQALKGALKPAYWQALIVVSLLYFARFDASFITLRARTVMSKAQLPLLTSVIMVTQAFISAPAGIRAKRSLKDRNQVLLLGYAAMIAADLTFAFMPTVYGMLTGAAFVGVHMALTHGVTLGMVASYIPATEIKGIGRITGTCWSFTDFIFGIILAYSNSVAGRLSDISVRANSGNIGCFLGGTVATLLSAAALILFTQFGALGKEEALTVKPKKA
ncbi:g6995 [Coccomyxa viridis]|uniref:G6995 protein n=1 Tax=Coccomyxa viridis TaxID=1274662 RepID=A0ABP1FWR6_9CHLO